MSTEEAQVPVFLSGKVSRSGVADFCMDGAAHLLHAGSGVTRLKADGKVQGDLESAVDSEERVAVAGYHVAGPECSHVSVYHVSRLEEALSKLDVNLST